MHCAKLTRVAILLLATSFVNGCGHNPPGTPPLTVSLPAPPKFMAACPPSAAQVGEPPNQAFDDEHAAFKNCSQQGVQSHSWYLRLRKRYATQPKG
jgi:hypothetical protein